MTIDFLPFPKIARLNRDITITEKLDGTNAAVVIVPTLSLNPVILEDGNMLLDMPTRQREIARVNVRSEDGLGFDSYSIFAQSRTRFITPDDDNYGFARWVENNPRALAKTLGEGTHFGEWWGAGIQRRYGLTGNDKRFSLFNTKRWADHEDHLSSAISGLGVVPLLYEGAFHQSAIDIAFRQLRDAGSVAAPGFTHPEGIVIFHHASRDLYKVTLEGDEAPKALPRDEHGNTQQKAAA